MCWPVSIKNFNGNESRTCSTDVSCCTYAARPPDAQAGKGPPANASACENAPRNLRVGPPPREASAPSGELVLSFLFDPAARGIIRVVAPRRNYSKEVRFSRGRRAASTVAVTFFTPRG